MGVYNHIPRRGFGRLRFQIYEGKKRGKQEGLSQKEEGNFEKKKRGWKT